MLRIGESLLMFTASNGQLFLLPTVIRFRLKPLNSECEEAFIYYYPYQEYLTPLSKIF
jgi:hypothetical protein